MSEQYTRKRLASDSGLPTYVRHRGRSRLAHKDYTVGWICALPRGDCDIRLGDVVVSTPISGYPAVIQHDLGKAGHNGISSIGSLNRPRSHLLTAVAQLRANHKLHPSKVQEYIGQALQRIDSLSDFWYPETMDILYQPDCRQSEGCQNATCSETTCVQRSQRAGKDTVIHYGTIASGNQVVKHGHIRDRIAAKSNILCIEMEAAGLMNEHRCLVIRGIADYCDSNKNKCFQGYAALAAAAVAKELLTVIPVQKAPHADSNDHQELITLLDFEGSDSRRLTVSKAHSQTCKWLFTQQEFLDWINPELLEVHRGLLWIKGKPGTGKSTIMRFVLERLEKERQPRDVIISFFFNARGQELEKSTLGMYRSLIYQLLVQASESQIILDGITDKTLAQPTQEVLESLFTMALEDMGHRRLFCVVDALDECPEAQIRGMVRFFEGVCELNASKDFHANVVFSSRHYPHISIDIGISFVLEDRDGHSADITKYIKGELKIGSSKHVDHIKTEIARRSSKIFLWVVLVVRILQKEYDRGRIHGLEKRLDQIPSEVNELIRDILTRDNNDLPSLQLCIQWILYAIRPLTREEFYFAMHAESEPITQWQSDINTTVVMDNFILDCSKGLAEVTRSEEASVQFIHESVREYFLRPDCLLNIHDELQAISPGQSHQRLRESCERQLDSDAMLELEGLYHLNAQARKRRLPQLQSKWPFLVYAIKYMYQHANRAAASGVSQIDFLTRSNFSRWAESFNTLRKPTTRYVPTNITCALPYYLSRGALVDLLDLSLRLYLPSNEDLVAALEVLRNKGHSKACHLLCTTVLKARSIDAPHAVDILLDVVFSMFPKSDDYSLPERTIIFDTLLQWTSSSQATLDAALGFAVYVKHWEGVRLLTQRGATGDYRNYWGQTPLHRSKDPEITEALIIHGADLEARDVRGCTPLLSAFDTDVFEVLLAEGADTKKADQDGRTLLFLKAERPGIIQLAIKHDSHLEHRDKEGLTPLLYLCSQSAASWHPYIRRTAKLLIHAGASLTARDREGQTPFLIAAGHSSKVMAMILFNHGAQPVLPPRATHSEEEWKSILRMGFVMRQLKRPPVCCELAEESTSLAASNSDIALA